MLRALVSFPFRLYPSTSCLCSAAPSQSNARLLPFFIFLIFIFYFLMGRGDQIWKTNSGFLLVSILVLHNHGSIEQRNLYKEEGS